MLLRKRSSGQECQDECKKSRIDSMETDSYSINLPSTSRTVCSETYEEDSITVFDKISSYCLYEIFDWLDINSLCSFSKTCKSLQITTKAYVSSKYPSLAIDIGDEDESIPQHVECFGDIVQHLQLSGASHKDFDIASSEINKNLRELSFNRTTTDKKEDHITKEHINSITNILKNVKTVCATSCIFEKGVPEYLLEKCESIEDFGFAVFENSKINIQFQKIPTLKNLGICFDSKVDVINTLNMIKKKKLHLDQLILAFEQEHNSQLNAVFNELETMHKNGLFKRLFLNFEKMSMLNIHISRLTSMPFLEGMICSYQIDRSRQHHLINLSKLKGIKYLCINHLLLLNADLIAQQLDQLVEVKIDGATIESITSFVRYSANLTKLITKHIRGNPKIDAVALSEQRALIKYNTKKLIIFIPEEKFIKLKWSFCTMIGNLVEIRREESKIPEKH